MSAFAPLPRAERWFVRGRMATAPLAELAARAPSGRILDVGCGHGALIALLAVDRADREVVGVDPDPRKVAWARASVGRLANVEIHEGTADTLLPGEEAAFDAVVIADVIYLLPAELWQGFLETVLRLLRPGGTLLLEEAEADGSWRQLKCTLQEHLMVRLLRRTRSSGGLTLMPRAHGEELLRRAGFEAIRSTSLSAGYTTPHLLMETRRPER